MAPRWTAEAEDLTSVGQSGTMAGGTAKAVLHTTESPSGGGNFKAMHDVLTSKKAEPHYLYDPATDRLGQYFALDRSARALCTGAGAVSCNKFGSHVIQIEVVAKAGDPFTRHWHPGPNFRAMMRDIRACGVPDTWVKRPASSYAAAGNLRVSYGTYKSFSGWLGHCHVPGQNDVVHGEGPRFGHWDPGAIDTAAFFAGTQHAVVVAAPTYVVRAGDNLTVIAGRFGTTVARLVQLNHIADKNKIFAGQVLKVA